VERVALRGGHRVGRAHGAAHDHGVVAHRPAHEAQPAPGNGGRRALAHHDQLLAAVQLAPREVVVVVHQLALLAAEDRDDLACDPLAPRVRVAPARFMSAK
jgi:hypothetical protein